MLTSKVSLANVSGVTHAATYVRHAAAANVYLTAISLTARRKPMPIVLKKRCFTLSVHSMWREDVQTAESAAAYVHREYRFIYLTANSSKILMNCMGNIRREKIQIQKRRLQTLRLRMQNQVL